MRFGIFYEHSFQRHRASRGFDREAIIANAAPLGVNVGSLRGAVGTPDQVAELCRRYEAVGVDQIVFVLQAGPTKHEHICEAIELFGKTVLPRFAEGRDEQEAAKAERLRPAIEAAMARRKPARELPPGYRIDEEAEILRARRARGMRRQRPAGVGTTVRSEARRRVRRGLFRLVHERPDEEIERRFGPAVQRIFFGGMARAFDPAMAMGFEGELTFRLTRTDGSVTPWTIQVKEKRARALPGEVGDPAVTVQTSTADFLRTIAGDANPASPLFEGRLKMRGDLELAPRISEMFGGPSPY